MAKIGLRAYNREIEQMIERGRIEEAIAHSKYILRFFPKHIETYRLLGKAYIESQRYSEAADILQRILSVLPDDFVSQIGMSIIREDEGNLDAAIFHMERAHEIQPSNVAVQDELRRLYGRRDGVEPPRLRLTRGALVRLYAKGDLYRQAIAEIRAALAEDPNRFDLEVILARMYNLQGQKVEATEIASRLVTKLPYCLEANRVLAEVLPSTSRAEDAKIYQQRVYVLDPYLAYISPNAPTSNLVPDNAVTLDRLDWQPVASGEEQPAWAQNAGISLEAEPEAEATPEWLSATPEEGQSFETAPESESLVSSAAMPSEIPAVGENEIPEWMQEAGWGAAAHPGVETAPAESVEEEAAIVPGEIPDWLKEIAPPSEVTSGSEEENKLDWLDKILPPVEAAEAVTAEPGVAAEGPVSGEISPEMEPPAGETQLQPETEAVPVEPLPDWLTFPEAEAPVQEITSSETTQFEEVTEAVPTEAIAEAVPTAAETIGVPAEDITETVPTAEETEGVQTEELVEAVTTQELTEAVPTTEMTEAVPTAEVTEGVPAEELVEAVPQQELTETVPTAEVTEAVPTEGIAEAVPTAEVTEAVPAEQIAEAVPTTEVTEVVPAEGIAEAVPTTEVMEVVPTEGIAEAVPTAAETEAAPIEEISEAIPTAEMTEAAPTEELAETVQAEAITEAVRPLEPTDVVSPQEMAEVVSAPVETEAAQTPVVPAVFPEEEIEFIPSETEIQASVQPEAVETTPAPAAEYEALAETPAEEKTQPIRVVPVQTQVPIPEAEIPAPETAEVVKPEELQPEAPVAEIGGEVTAISTAESIPAPTAEAASVAAAQPDLTDIDAAMAWLESLAAKQGAEEATLFTAAEERPAAPPEWVSEELAKSQAKGVEEITAEGVKAVEEPIAEMPAKPAEEVAAEVALPQAAEPVTELPAEPVAENIPEVVQPAVEEIAAETTEVEIPLQAAPMEEEVAVGEPPAPSGGEVAPTAVEEPVTELPATPEVATALPVDQYTTSDKKTAPLGEAKAAVAPEEMDEEAAFAWLESLAANQGADEGTLITPEAGRPTSAPAWVLEQAAPEGGLTDASDLLEGSLAAPEIEKPEIEEVRPTLVESKPVSPQPTESVEEPAAVAETPAAKSEEPLPSWLQEFEPVPDAHVKEVAPASEEDLPDWLKGFETTAEAPITQASDESISVSTWLTQKEVPPQAQVGPKEEAAPEVPVSEGVSLEPPAARPAPSESTSPEKAALSDNPLLAQAQTDLLNGKIESAVNTFNQFIEQGQYLDEIIRNLQDTLYQYPVEISLWQTLGDAYIRCNRIQEALDAYTKAEDLLK